MAYKRLQFGWIASSCPENLVFFRTEQLIQVARSSDDRYSEQARIACTAELLVRRFLNSESVDAVVLDQIFPQKEWQRLESLLRRDVLRPPTGEHIEEGLWDASPGFAQRCEPVVRRRFLDLLDRTDGFVPVYEKGGTDAFFIPFHLEPSQDGPQMVDARDCPINAWGPAACGLLGPSLKCVMRCVQSEIPLPLDGMSFMLPVWMAVQRRNGSLPEYNRLRLFATGEIQDGHLVAVEVGEKLSGLRGFAQQAYLLFPESGQLVEDGRTAVALKATCTLDDVRENIFRQIEEKGLVVPTLKDALERLERFKSEVYDECFSRWRNMLTRVETYASAVTERRNPEVYLLCLMLKSTICCHMGETTKALALNRAAKDVACKCGFEQKLRRLEIEELVELQDQEKFREVLDLAGGLKTELENLEDDDLLMRYHGTLGQAHCYGVLSGSVGCSQEAALSHFDRACQYAFRLESELDIAQDLNYRYLWYVLFEPGSVTARDAYQEARDQIERHLHAAPKGQMKNRFFLERLRLMEVYRILLSGKRIPLGAPGMRLPDQAIPWLKALVCKYLGACAAADGRRDEARELFREGRELLSGEQDDTIIAMIRMTISAEAYRSLGEKDFREQALDDLPRLEKIAAIGQWERFLRDEGAFPGLTYWY